jgi:hypothetical protein
LKNDRKEGKTIRSIVEKKKVGRREKNKPKVAIKHLQSPPQLEQGGNKNK